MPDQPTTITKDNLIAVLCDPRQRYRLRKAMHEEQEKGMPLTNRYAELARTCMATPEQLHQVVKVMLRYRRRYGGMLCDVVFHPGMSDATLFLLYERRCCLSYLGHRAGPRSLLERIAAEHRYSEAITTLALRYYNKLDYSAEAFADFLREHADDPMLRGNILCHAGLPPDKQEAVQRVFGTLDDGPSLFDQAKAKSEAQEYDQALNLLQTLLAEKPKHPGALLHYVRILGTTRQWDVLAQFCTDEVLAVSGEVRLWHVLALAGSDRRPEALARYEAISRPIRNRNAVLDKRAAFVLGITDQPRTAPP
jgi:tetratricopeptide (TPR) repeat protein